MLPREMEAMQAPFPTQNDGLSLDPSSAGTACARRCRRTFTPSVEVPSPQDAEAPPFSTLRSPFRPGTNPQSTVRAVTPEPAEMSRDALNGGSDSLPVIRRGFSSMPPPTSPMPILGAAATVPGTSAALSTGRRQGVVFNDTPSGSYDSSSSSPPPKAAAFRPRTHTMDSALRPQQPTPSVETRHRVGPFSSSSSMPAHDDPKATSLHTSL